jgi:hypothetical protein
MAATAKFPAAEATADDWTSSNAGMGREKSDDKDPKRPAVNFIATEYNQQNVEIIAAQAKIGIDGHEPVGVAGSLDKSFDFLLNHWVPRLDQPGFVEAFLMDTGFLGAGVHSPYLTLINATAADGINYAQSDALAAAFITAPAVVQVNGWDSSAIFHQQSTYYAARVKVDGLPASAGDYFQFGIRRDATHYVLFHSTKPAGAWPVWTVEVKDAGSTWSDTLTAGSPADIDESGAGGWVTFEILTTSTGAYFYYNRGEANAEYKGPGTQAPQSARASIWTAYGDNGGVGGDTIYYSGTACKDTRTLFGP